MFDWFKTKIAPKPAPAAEPDPGKVSAPGTASASGSATDAVTAASAGTATGAHADSGAATQASAGATAAQPSAGTTSARPDSTPPAAPIVSTPTWRERLKAGLARTRAAVGLNRLLGGKLDEATLEDLESALLTADAGVAATGQLIDDLRQRWKKQGGESGPATPKELLKTALTELLTPLEGPLDIGPQRPFVIMLAGVNGAGKTTTIGKLARYLQANDLSVLLAAGDTFRAAAREQLQVWGERNNVTVIAQEGGDPAAVMFDAVQAAKARGIDIVLADTAGRLPTQLHLMEELKKIKRVIQKADPSAPHEVLLVLDGNTGQNALAQLQSFDAALGVTGVVLTKLDGTAKGGVVAAIAKTKPVPLRFIGVGEGVEDLKPFIAADFAGALLDE